MPPRWLAGRAGLAPKGDAGALHREAGTEARPTAFLVWPPKKLPDRSADTMFLEEAQHVLPAVGRRFGIVARAVIGIEAVIGVGIDDEGCLDLFVLGDLGFHRRDIVLADALVEPAIEAEQRHLQRIDDIDRMSRERLAGFADERAVPGDGSLELGIVS